MSTFAEIAEQVWLHLENRALYPLREVLENGINPAMRLLTLLDPDLLTQRTAVTLPALSMIIDLRSVAPRTHQVLRVVLGDATTEVQTRTASHFTPVVPTTRERLALLRPDWLRAEGVPSKFFLLGRHLLACWPRPVMDVVVTIIAAAVPTAAWVETQASSPELDVAQHPLIADIAAALLLCKQGVGEADRAVQTLTATLGKEPFTVAAKRLREMQVTRAEPLPLTAAATP